MFQFMIQQKTLTQPVLPQLTDNTMQYRITVIVAFAGALFSDAFRCLPTRARAKSSLQMAVIDPDMPGQLPPLGYFDPLGFADGTDEKIFKRWRESEVNLVFFELTVSIFFQHFHNFPN